MVVVLKPTLPTEKFPPDPRQVYEATPLQALIIRNYLEKGYREGTVRLYKRLRARIGDRIHPGMDISRPADDPDNYQRQTTGKPLLDEKHDYDDECQYTGADGIVYQIPCSAVWKYQIDPATGQPITIRRGEPRLFPKQSQKMEFESWRPRRLCPTVRQIEEYFRRDPHVQMDRPARKNVAGGRRNHPTTSVQPIFPRDVLDDVFVDTMRLPVAGHVYEDHDVSAKELLKQAPLMGGAGPSTRAQTRQPPAKLRPFRWLFVAVDLTSKFVWVKEMAQIDHLDVVGKTTAVPRSSDSTSASSRRSLTGSNDGENDDDDDEEQDQDQGERNPRKRPQSEATYNAMKTFIKRANEIRQQAKPSLPYLLPKKICHDNGKEFEGVFKEKMEKLRGKYPGYFKESITSNSRSQHNAPGERAVQTVRKYFYALYNSFQRRPNPNEWPTNKLQLENWQRGRSYDWILDIPLVLKRVNTAYHTTIRCTPMQALTQQVSTALVKERIKNADHKRMEGLRHELPLPGFSPSSPPEIGSFVRLKLQSGMSSTWPRDGSKNTGSKSASHNWSTEIYVVTEVKIINYGVKQALLDQEALQKRVDEAEDGSLGLTQAQKTELKNQVSGARLYKVQPIDRRKRKAFHDNGRRFSWLTRVDILKIPAETKVDGRTIPEMIKFYDDLAASEAVDAAMEAERERERPEGAERPPGRPRKERVSTRVGSPFKWGVLDTLIFANGDEVKKLIQDKTGKRVTLKNGQLDGDVVKIVAIPTPRYVIDFGTKRQTLLISFGQAQLEGDDLVRLGDEEVSFAFDIGSQIQFPRAWFTENWHGDSATSDAARFIGDGDDLRFDDDNLLGEVVGHEYDRSARTLVKYFYTVRFKIRHRAQQPLSLAADPAQQPPTSIVVDAIPRTDIEGQSSGIPIPSSQRS